MHADDHRGRDVSLLERSAPLRDQLTVTGEHHRLGRIPRHVHRDLPTTVVLERFGDQLSNKTPVAHRGTQYSCVPSSASSRSSYDVRHCCIRGSWVGSAYLGGQPTSIAAGRSS